MPNKYLYENGYACPSCELRHEEQDKGEVDRPSILCNRCGGEGRLAYTAQKIIDNTPKHKR